MGLFKASKFIIRGNSAYPGYCVYSKMGIIARKFKFKKIKTLFVHSLQRPASLRAVGH